MFLPILALTLVTCAVERWDGETVAVGMPIGILWVLFYPDRDIEAVDAGETGPLDALRR